MTNLDLSLKLAKENFAQKNPQDISYRAGGDYEQVNCANSMISLNLLGQEYTIVHPGGGIESPDNHQVTIITHILILHYLTNAIGSPLSGELVAYKDIPGGDKYFSVFKKRVEMPVVNAYGDNPEGFAEACMGLGGEEVKMGDKAFRFQAFPRVPIIYIYWKGDEEFPASIQVLFDSSIRYNLPLEDIVYLSEMLSWKLVRFIGKGVKI